MKFNKKTISRATIVVGSITVPAAITVGLVYGIEKEDTRVVYSPATSLADHFFDQSIAPSSSNLASRLILTPPNGHALTELVRLDDELDYERLIPMLKKNSKGKKEAFWSKTISFDEGNTIEAIRKKLTDVNEEVFQKTLKTNDRNAPYSIKSSKVANGATDKVKISTGSSRVGIDIRKDLIKRQILVSLFDLTDEDPKLKAVADEFMEDIGTINLSNISFKKADKNFFEIFSGSLPGNNIDNLSNYFSFDGVSASFGAEWGSTKYLEKMSEYLGIDFPLLDSFSNFEITQDSALSVDTRAKELVAKFPKAIRIKIAKYIKSHNNSATAIKQVDTPFKYAKLYIGRNKGYHVGKTKQNKRMKYFIKDGGPVGINVKPIYDFNTGQVKLIFSFMELYKKVNAKGEITESSEMTTANSTLRFKNYKNITRRIVSFNIKHLLPAKNKPTPDAKKKAAILLKSRITGRLKEYAGKSFIDAGVKLIQSLIPNLGSAMESFLDLIKLINIPDVSKKVLTPEFIDRLVEKLSADPSVNFEKYFELLENFDVEEWASIAKLADIDPYNGGEIDMFLFTSGWHSISEMIAKEIKQKAPGASIQYSGPVIKELLDELKKLRLIKQSAQLNNIIQDPLKFGKTIATKLITEHVEISDKLASKIIPMVPLEFVQKNAKGIQAALKIIIGDGGNLDSILTELITSNKPLIEKLKTDWVAADPGNRILGDINHKIEIEILVSWLFSSEATRIDLTNKLDVNIVSVVLRTHFSPESILILGKAIAATHLAPSFLSSIIPNTPSSAKVISNLFKTGATKEIFELFQDIYINGLDDLMKPGLSGAESTFVITLRKVTDKVLKVIEFDKLFPGLPSGIKTMIKDKVGIVLETVLRTPISGWPALFETGKPLRTILDTVKGLLPSSIGSTIDKITEIVHVVGGLFTGGIKTTIPTVAPSATDKLDTLLTTVSSLVPSVSEYTGLIKGLLHGFRTYDNFKEQVTKVAPTLFDSLKIDIPVIGKLDLGESLLKPLISGQPATGLISRYIDEIIKPPEYKALTTLLRGGLLKMTSQQIDSVVVLLKEIWGRDIHVSFLQIAVNIGDKIPAPAAIKNLLKSFTVATTSKLINEFLTKPLATIPEASWNELLKIISTATDIKLPVGTGKYIVKMLTTPLTSLTTHEIRVVLEKVLPVAGLGSSSTLITDWVLKILVGDNALSHPGQAQTKKLNDEIGRFATLATIPAQAAFSAPLPKNLVSESAIKPLIDALIAKIKASTDIIQNGRWLAQLTIKIDELQHLKDAVVAANLVGSQLKAKLVLAQTNGKLITIPPAIPFKYSNTMPVGTSPQELIAAFSAALTYVPTNSFSEVNSKLRDLTDIVKKVTTANAHVTYLNSKFISDSLWAVLTAKTGAFSGDINGGWDKQQFITWDATTKTLKIRLISRDDGWLASSTEHYRLDEKTREQWIPDGTHLKILLNGKTIHIASLNGRIIFYEDGNKPNGAVDIVVNGMDHNGNNNINAAITIKFKDTTLREQASVVYNFAKLDPDYAKHLAEQQQLARDIVAHKETLTLRVNTGVPAKDFTNRDWELYRTMMTAKETALEAIKHLNDKTIVPTEVTLFETAKTDYSNSSHNIKPVPTKAIPDDVWNALISSSLTTKTNLQTGGFTVVINNGGDDTGAKNTPVVITVGIMKIHIADLNGVMIFYVEGHKPAGARDYKNTLTVDSYSGSKKLATITFNSDREVTNFVIGKTYGTWGSKTMAIS